MTSELIAQIEVAAIKAKVAAEDYSSGDLSAAVFADECAEFNCLTDSPEQILAVLAYVRELEQRISQLTAERDALRESELIQGSNTRAAADIYFQLVEECRIPPGGSLVEHIDDMRSCIAEMTMLIKRLSHSLRCARPDSKLPADAMKYLSEHGLISVGDILR